MIHTRLLLAAAVLAGCIEPADLPEPRFERWNFTNGSLCSSTVLLDGESRVWTESGCEARSSGWAQRGSATDDQRARVVAAFDALPPGAGCSDDGGVEWIEYVGLRRTGDGGTAHWTVCELPDGVPAPEYAEAVEAMNALAH